LVHMLRYKTRLELDQSPSHRSHLPSLPCGGTAEVSDQHAMVHTICAATPLHRRMS